MQISKRLQQKQGRHKWTQEKDLDHVFHEKNVLLFSDNKIAIC